VPAVSPSRCPDASFVKQYVSGALDESAAAEFARHLEHCPRCQRQVDGQEHDSLLHALRHSPANVAPNDETALHRLIDRAQQLPPTSQEAAETVTATPPEAVPLDVFVSCLGKSGLVNASEVELLVEQSRPPDSTTLATLLISRKKLTLFQAKMLLRGRWKGLVLGNYILLEKLGQGGMGTVFKARHRRMGRIVCLKVLHASHRKSPAVLERFRREAQTVAALQHPNIVVAHDADEADGIPFLVMELIKGNDLAQRVAREGPLAAEEAVDVVLQAAHALDYAHRRGVIHRDIKPHNLLVDDAGAVKILDMGLARFDSYLNQNADASTHASMTVSGIIMGTVDYMAPEQALNSRRADHRSDIYSLGCTLHFLLTGNVVYAGETVMEKLVAHREQPVPNLCDGQANVPRALDAVFQHMVAKDPAERYASMAELVDDLEALRNGRKPAALSWLAPESGRVFRRTALAATVLAFTAVIGVGLWLTRSTWYPSPELAQAKLPAPPPTAPPTPVPLPEPIPPPPLVGHPKTRANGGPGRAMVVLAHDWFIEEDYTSIEKVLKSRGITFAVASSKAGPAQPKHNAIPPVPVELTLDKFDVNDFDAVVFLGGNYYEFTHRYKFSGDRAKQIVTECLDKGKPVAAMNIAILILDEAGFTAKATFEQKGGCWIGRSPGSAGQLVTTKEAKYAGELVEAIFGDKGTVEKSLEK
jgi:serine/threonine protein kinase